MQPKESSPSLTPEKLDHFIVCGLGSLGQHCVVALKEFGVKIIAIEQVQPQNWEIPNVSDLLEDLIFADCRQNNVLEQAKIRQCRAALLLTTSEQVNAETALAIRQLNPSTRLVVRSAKTNLNQLLSEQLGNFIAFEPTQLPATAFALAALGTEILGYFELDRQRLIVLQRYINSSDRWCNTRLLQELNTHNRRILAHFSDFARIPQAFHQWELNAPLLAGDTLVYIEVADQFLLSPTQQPTTSFQSQKRLGWQQRLQRFGGHLKHQLYQFWQLSFQQQVRRVALGCGIMVLLLLLIGTVLFRSYYPGTTLLSAFYATVILLLGGYADLFGEFEKISSIPEWLQLFAFLLTVVGTVFVGILYALLTEALLSSQFQLVKNRPPVPQQDHIVIIGLGRVGQQVASLLLEFQQTLVGITCRREFDGAILSKIPVIEENLAEALAKANFATAKSVVIVTDDEILNLEAALMTQTINPKSHIVIRTSGQRLSEHLTQILPKAQVLGAYRVAAEAFAGAAFGENIINLFRFNHQTILVTEYYVEADDTLNGLLLSDIAYGYGVVPLLYQKSTNTSTLIPSDDIRLMLGDRIVILATIDGLRRVEQGRLTNKSWRVQVEKALTQDAIFEGANVIARISGCPLNVARELMNHLPGTLPVFLYKHQGLRLVGMLRKTQVTASLTEFSP